MRRRSVWPVLGLALLAAAASTLARPPAASASHLQQSFFQDDRLLANANFFTQIQAVNQLSALGVDTIHSVVNWRGVAPSPGSRTPPRGFDGSNPAAYPPGAWDRYDNLVRLAQAKGISVLLSPAGPVPNWASGCKVNVNRACKPNAAMYRQFYTALATRYSGNYVDEDQDQQKLPRVGRWDVWNEPNLGAWLYPQTIKSHGKRIQVAAAYYRRLVYAAMSALRATGHAQDEFMVAETAPIGGGATRTSPSDFLLGVFCLDPHGKRFRGKLARTEGCVHAKRISVSALTHHPYARGASVPTSTRERAGSLTIGTLGRFPPLLRQIRRSPIAPHRALGVYFTEFGVSSRPPDGKFGVPLDRQAQYLNEVDYLAYGRSWIKGVSQFQLEDDTGLAIKNTFQTGLMFRNGAPKPSLLAYRIPIFVVTTGKRVTVFGQVRPVRGGMSPQTVQIQFRARGKDWQTVATRRTNPRGYVSIRVRAARGAWRLRWQEPSGVVSYSRTSGAVPTTTPTTPGLPPPGPGTPPTPPAPGTNPGTPPPTGPPPPPAPPPVQRFTLGVTVSGPQLGTGSVTSNPGGITCDKSGGSCSAQYDSGTSVTLTANTSLPFTTVQWTGACSDMSPTCAVTLDQARNVTATFSP